VQLKSKLRKTAGNDNIFFLKNLTQLYPFRGWLFKMHSSPAQADGLIRGKIRFTVLVNSFRIIGRLERIVLVGSVEWNA
jgi:hypothetical protein